jgi:hypothetical protein
MKSWPCYCSNATSIKLGNRDSQKWWTRWMQKRRWVISTST